jgi:hypothetical protein
MKKLSLVLFVISFFITLCLNAQDQGLVKAVRTAKWTDSTKWVYSPWIDFDEPLTFNFYTSMINIDNSSHTRYIFTDGGSREIDGNSTMTTWKAIDNEGKNCTILLFYEPNFVKVRLSAIYNSEQITMVSWKIVDGSMYKMGGH